MATAGRRRRTRPLQIAACTDPLPLMLCTRRTGCSQHTRLPRRRHLRMVSSRYLSVSFALTSHDSDEAHQHSVHACPTADLHAGKLLRHLLSDPPLAVYRLLPRAHLSLRPVYPGPTLPVLAGDQGRIGSLSLLWHAVRARCFCLAVRLTPISVNQYTFSPPSTWTLTPANAYNPPAIANSVLQRFNPTSAYPTPPPPGIRSSSSSLAFALGYPTQVKSQPRVYKPEESGPFFKDFLNRSAQLLDSKPVQSTNTPQPSPTKPESLPPKQPPPAAVAQASVTPRKRKSPDESITPSRKRIHAANLTSSPSTLRSASETPSHKSSKSSRQVLAYVNVPPPTWKTKSHSGDLASGDESADGDGDYARHDFHANVKSSARRTGDRDERGRHRVLYLLRSQVADLTCITAPLERLNTLVEDILEAEDSLAADIEPADLPKEFFSPLTVDCNHPHLQPAIIRKLTKYISQLARPSKRSRRTTREGIANASSGSRGRDTLGDIGTPILSRLLKILERSIKAGEDLDPLRTSTYHPPPPSSPSKSKKGQKGSTDGMNAQEDRLTVHDSHPQQFTDSDVHELAVQLEVSRDSIFAAECCMALLSGESLTKQVRVFARDSNWFIQSHCSFTRKN